MHAVRVQGSFLTPRQLGGQRVAPLRYWIVLPPQDVLIRKVLFGAFGI
jgi:hypothetical protein